MLSQNNDSLNRDPRFSTFIIGVGSLTDMDDVGNFLLTKPFIFSEESDSFVIFHIKIHDLAEEAT